MTSPWVEFVVGPMMLLLTGWFLDRRNGRRIKDMDAKVEEARTAGKVVRKQVENSHDINLRDDLDAKFEAVFARFDMQDKRSDSQADDIRELRRNIGRVHERIDTHLTK